MTLSLPPSSSIFNAILKSLSGLVTGLGSLVRSQESSSMKYGANRPTLDCVASYNLGKGELIRTSEIDYPMTALLLRFDQAK